MDTHTKKLLNLWLHLRSRSWKVSEKKSSICGEPSWVGHFGLYCLRLFDPDLLIRLPRFPSQAHKQTRWTRPAFTGLSWQCESIPSFTANDDDEWDCGKGTSSLASQNCLSGISFEAAKTEKQHKYCHKINRNNNYVFISTANIFVHKGPVCKGHSHTRPAVLYCARAHMNPLPRAPAGPHSHCPSPNCAVALLLPLHASSSHNTTAALL